MHLFITLYSAVQSSLLISFIRVIYSFGMDNFTIEPYLQWQKSSYDNLILVPTYVIVACTYFVTIFLAVLRLVSWKAEWRAIFTLKEADRKIIAYVLETLFSNLQHREGTRDLTPSYPSNRGWSYKRRVLL